MHWVIKSIDKATDIALLLFFFLLFLIGAYTMYDTYLIYNSAKGEDLRGFKPNVVEADEGWDLSALSDDVVAWLTVEGTSIDYPVMQGIDNSEYLNKDPFGNYSLAGSLFLDSRNSKDFSDSYSLIYGHHMEHGAMFGALDDFLTESYFIEHRDGTLTVNNKVYKIKFFASLEADGADKEIFAPTETDGTLDFVRENALIWYEPDGEHLLALSTCKFPETTERIVLFGVLEDA